MKQHKCHDPIPYLESYFAVAAIEEAHDAALKQDEKVTVFTAMKQLEQLEKECEAIIEKCKVAEQ